MDQLICLYTGLVLMASGTVTAMLTSAHGGIGYGLVVLGFSISVTAAMGAHNKAEEAWAPKPELG